MKILNQKATLCQLALRTVTTVKHTVEKYVFFITIRFSYIRHGVRLVHGTAIRGRSRQHAEDTVLPSWVEHQHHGTGSGGANSRHSGSNCFGHMQTVSSRHVPTGTHFALLDSVSIKIQCSYSSSHNAQQSLVARMQGPNISFFRSVGNGFRVTNYTD